MFGRIMSARSEFLFSPTREGAEGPRTLTLTASQSFVYKELTERVVIVTVSVHCCAHAECIE